MKRKSPTLALIIGLPFWILLVLLDMDAIWLAPVYVVAPLYLVTVGWQRPLYVADVNAELVDMNTIPTESDFLSISVPLSEQTYHLISEEELKKMKSTAYPINSARGAAVDEKTLISALQQGWIRGAGLDVFEQEPVDLDNPLLKMDNVLVSTHSLCHTYEFFMRASNLKIEQAAQIIQGEIPAALVNKEVLERPVFQTKFERCGGFR